MRKYGKQLMSELPDATTDLLNRLCSDWIPKGAESTQICTEEREGEGEDVIYH